MPKERPGLAQSRRACQTAPQRGALARGVPKA